MANTSEKSTEVACLQNVNYCDYLPDEILFKIFLDVPRIHFYLLAKVSSRFERLCRDKRFWGTVTVTKPSISYFEFEQLFSDPCLIRELDLTGIEVRSSKVRNANLQVSLDKLNISRARPDSTTNWIFEPVFLDLAVVTTCRPKELIINAFRLTSDMANAIAKCTELQVLTMEFVEIYDTSNTDSLKRMFRSVSELKELNMKFTHATVYAWLAVQNTLSENVEKLFFNHATFVPCLLTDVDGTALTTIVAQLISGLLDRLKNLRYLGFSLDNFAQPSVIEQVVELECLEALYFCTCDFEEPKRNLLSEYVRRSPNLKRLIFSMNCPFGEEANIESAQNDLKNWFKELSSKNTIISFTEVECVIELVDL